ncbi:radical SAM/SPASM domain-containing protein [Helicobacter sp. MIT 11-5569]|uniref:radical SAM/SPASM domain-containing protein n=1 Tax=Helicobacter sp. MIT 11-5569 TaxID=1548151 RepID=UPI00051FB968|nr:radical SAM/SPASM domain-containing protein [Helicobacter sp. MIT 11-5569]TLD83210.1 radical SAM/SPASM domain-containing protein [Helicobacter sp. MIT 11-5569]
MSKQFEKVFVEITNFCGLHCSFCTPKKDTKATMPLALFKKIAQEISPVTKLCALHILGDPLTLNNLNAYLDLAKHLKLEITTSGFFLDSKAISLLLNTQNIQQINLSLTSALYQNKPIAINSYLEPILELCEQHKHLQSEKFINLRLWNLNLDLSAPKENVILYQKIQDFFNLKTISPKKTRLAYKIHLLGAHFFEWVDLENLKNTTKTLNGFCYGASKQLGILCNGSVVPCCFDTKGTITLGNLNTQSLSEILHSKRTQNLIQGFQQNIRIEEFCQACKYPEYLKKKVKE